MPKVKVNDINIYHEVHGEGYPLVLIGGTNHHIHKYPPQFIELLSKHFKIILFENRGSGRTDQPDIRYTHKMMADDTAGLMDALKVEKAHVLGSSLGGMIAQELALNYPEKINKLVLCCTSCGPKNSIPPSPKVLRIYMQSTEGMTEEELVRRNLPTFFPKDYIKKNPELIDDYVRRSLLIPQNPIGLKRQMAMISSGNTFKRLKNISAPTLIVHGKKDLILPSKNAEILAGQIPGAKVLYLEKSAHLLFSIETELLVRELNNFLS